MLMFCIFTSYLGIWSHSQFSGAAEDYLRVRKQARGQHIVGGIYIVFFEKTSSVENQFFAQIPS